MTGTFPLRPSRLRRLASGPVPMIALAVLLFASLILMSNATQGSARFGQLYSVLLVVNSVGLFVLAALSGWHFVSLVGQVRRQVPGARLTARMVAMFVMLAVTPVLVVYYFSLQFLHRGIDSWFDVRVEQALDDSLELSRTALGVRMRELLKQTQAAGALLGEASEAGLVAALDDALELSGATELTLMGEGGQIVLWTSTDPTAVVPNRPDEAVLSQLRRARSYVALEPIAHTGLHIRVVVEVSAQLATGDPMSTSTKGRILQALYPVAGRMNELADGVQSAFAQYRELAYLRKPLKLSFTLTLSLVLLLALFTAVWAAFLSARRMVAPIRDVAEGTRAVAQGEYETQLPPSGDDEIGFLVQAFNDMTRQLARARDETRHSQARLEEQRTYLEAVLARLTSGVLTLDPERRLFTANHAAGQILGIELEGARGGSLEDAARRHSHLQPLAEAVSAHLGGGREDWREEVTLLGPSGRQVLMCRGTPLASAEQPLAGHLVVFDDITALIQAQRDAAWSEMARRLAHEIKNPLTPIRLSAERLQHKYLERLPADEAPAFKRLTRTIVQHVEGMQDMVNAFSDYARTPRMSPAIVDLNELIGDVVALYRGSDQDVRIETGLEEHLPPMQADADRLRQVLHNLIKNALEAAPENVPARIRIDTSAVHEDATSYITVRVSDAGTGFPPAILERAFEPYATSKSRGSGLGLAIVKKIVEEHSGVVWAENNADHGASVVMRFPAVESDAARSAGQRREAV